MDAQENQDNVIFRVKYLPEELLSEVVTIYDGEVPCMILKDDGVFPDIVEGDYTYATKLDINIPALITEITNRMNKIISEGGILNFIGHDGEFIQAGISTAFDFEAFNNFQQVQIHESILNATDCITEIIKQNSLFITDLSVVEDDARTFNVNSGTGNPDGVWTFGSLIKNIANEPVTGVSPQVFLKEWLRNWTLNQNVGSFGQSKASSGYFDSRQRLSDNIDVIIGNWVRKARQASGDLGYNQTLGLLNWENEWNGTDPDYLIKYAPFKLMAIVNRLDLRGNSAYSGSLNNAGETRFIYTLIDPFTGDPPSHCCINSAAPTSSPGGSGVTTGIDWVGMNVILEYGNPFTDNCALKNFAEQWYDLSAYTLGTDDYLDHLEAITTQVTDAGVGGSKNFNQSALNQIRTNEKMFGGVINCYSAIPACMNGNGEWRTADWELRQFSFTQNPDGLIHQVPLTNTLVDKATTGGMSYSFNGSPNMKSPDNSQVYSTEYALTNSDVIIDWIYGASGTSSNRHRVAVGNYNLPEPFLDGTAQIYGEASHHFGFEWYNSSSLFPGSTSTAYINNDVPDLLAKKVRHQISLNTCQGCHGGETKTNFTMMIPRGYGEPANYWDAIPTYVTANDNHTNVTSGGIITGTQIDPRFMVGGSGAQHVDNMGQTYDPYFGTSGGNVTNAKFDEKAANTTNQIVSAFITGRLYSSATWNNWEDDMLNNTFEASPNISLSNVDKTIADLYYVNDPTNDALTCTLPNGKGGSFPQQHDKKWGFNELERRKMDLCNFINSNCTGAMESNFLNIAFRIKQIPLPKDGH